MENFVSTMTRLSMDLSIFDCRLLVLRPLNDESLFPSIDWRVCGEAARFGDDSVEIRFGSFFGLSASTSIAVVAVISVISAVIPALSFNFLHILNTYDSGNRSMHIQAFHQSPVAASDIWVFVRMRHSLLDDCVSIGLPALLDRPVLRPYFSRGQSPQVALVELA
jgi:hypothetical protein